MQGSTKHTDILNEFDSKQENIPNAVKSLEKTVDDNIKRSFRILLWVTAIGFITTCCHLVFLKYFR